MSLEDVRQVLEMPRTGLSGADFPVLVLLAWHRHAQSGVCNPGYKILAQEACVSKDTIAKSVENLKRLGIVEFVSGKGNTSNDYTLHIPASRGMGSERIPYGLSEGMGSERIRGERRELNTSVSVSDSVSASVSVEQFNSAQMTEDRRQQQEQEQRQNQRLGGTTPEPPIKESLLPSACLELERVWKGVTKAPCYPRNFIPLLAAYPVDHIAAVIRWTFKTSNYWNIRNSAHFCKRVKGTFPVFAHLSAQYERYMEAKREGEVEEAQQPSPAPAVLAGPAPSTNYEEPEELDLFILPSVRQQPNPPPNKRKGSSPYNDRFRKNFLGGSTPITPAEEDPALATRRCVSHWKGKHPRRPCDENDMDYLLNHFDEDDILFAIRHFHEYEWWSEEIRDSGDFRDRFSEILQEVKPVEPPLPDDEEF